MIRSIRNTYNINRAIITDNPDKLLDCINKKKRPERFIRYIPIAFRKNKPLILYSMLIKIIDDYTENNIDKYTILIPCIKEYVVKSLNGTFRSGVLNTEIDKNILMEDLLRFARHSKGIVEVVYFRNIIKRNRRPESLTYLAGILECDNE